MRDGTGTETPIAARLPKIVRAILRDVENNEPTWGATFGGWDTYAGFFKGFGLGLTIQVDEFDLTLGPLSLGGVKRGR